MLEVCTGLDFLVMMLKGNTNILNILFHWFYSKQYMDLSLLCIGFNYKLRPLGYLSNI